MSVVRCCFQTRSWNLNDNKRAAARDDVLRHSTVTAVRRALAGTEPVSQLESLSSVNFRRAPGHWKDAKKPRPNRAKSMGPC